MKAQTIGNKKFSMKKFLLLSLLIPFRLSFKKCKDDHVKLNAKFLESQAGGKILTTKRDHKYP